MNPIGAPTLAAPDVLPHLPPPNPADRQRMERDIVETRKVYVPLLVTPDVPESIRRDRRHWVLLSYEIDGQPAQGVIVDGVERWRVIHSHRVKDYQITVTARGMTEREIALLRIRINSHRRHLTQIQLRQLIGALLASGLGIKATARTTGASINTVRSVDRRGIILTPPPTVTVPATQASRAMAQMARLEVPPPGHRRLKDIEKRVLVQTHRKAKEPTARMRRRAGVRAESCDFRRFAVEAESASLILADPDYSKRGDYLTAQRLERTVVPEVRPGSA